MTDYHEPSIGDAVMASADTLRRELGDGDWSTISTAELRALRARVGELEERAAFPQEAAAVLEDLEHTATHGGEEEVVIIDRALTSAYRDGAESVRERAAAHLVATADDPRAGSGDDPLDGLDVDGVLRTMAAAIRALPLDDDAREERPASWCTTCGEATGEGVTECGECARWWRENQRADTQEAPDAE